MKEHDLDSLVRRAREAQRGWAALGCRKRSRVLFALRANVTEEADRITEVISRCTGKTRIDALGSEVIPIAMALGFYARGAPAVIRPRKIRGRNPVFFNKPSYLHRAPFGVVGIISPWNYPFGIPMHEIAMALSVGNAVLLKTASQAGPVADLMQDLFTSAGLPPGLLHLVSLPGREAGDALIRSGIDKLFFTGSVEAARELMSRGASRLLPMALELGGNDAMIVLEDANLPRAVGGALWGGLSNCGQSCSGVERIYVLRGVYEGFVRLLRRRVGELRQGRDTSFEVDVGPLANEKQKTRIRRHVEEALARGARITAQAGKDEGLFYPVTILEDVDDGMAVMREETFGPVLAIRPVDTVEEAVERANATDYGLSASVWTANLRKAREIAGRLEAGTVMINDHLMSHGMPETPWGGFKRSGNGGSRTHGLQGLEAMTQPRVVVEERLHRFMPSNMWWFPHRKSVYDGLRGLLDLLYGRSWGRRIRGLRRLLPAYLRSFKKEI